MKHFNPALDLPRGVRALLGVALAITGGLWLVVIAGLVLLLASRPAHAAEPSPVDCTPTDARYIHTGTLANGDWWSYHWCADGTYQWGVARPSLFSPANRVASQARNFGLPYDAAALRAPTPPEQDAIDALWNAVQAAIAVDKDRPATTSWAVAKNASYGDRPAYPFIDGVRGTKSSARAKVGAACDCSVKTVEGSTTYCGVAPQLVAVCTRVEAPPPTPPAVAPPSLIPPAKPPAAGAGKVALAQ